MLFLAAHPDHAVFAAPVPSCSLLLPVPWVVTGNQSCHHRLVLCGEVRKCIFMKLPAHGSIGQLQESLVCPLPGHLCARCSAGSARGVLGSAIPMGNLQAELGETPGPGWDRLSYSRGEGWDAGAAVGVMGWIHHCWVSVTLSWNLARFLNLLVESLYREASI